MKNRSYIRIVNRPKNQDESTFTPISNKSNRMPRARRRRTKERKALSENHTSPISFDEQSLSHLSAHATPFKPTKILQRPKRPSGKKAAKSKPIIPPMRMYNHRGNASETFTQRKLPNATNASFHNQMHHAPFGKDIIAKHKNKNKNINKNNKINKSPLGSTSLGVSPSIFPM
eukprot:154325_1